MKTVVPDGNASVYYFNPRLRKRLAAIGECPMIVVEAPMGYGKTVAVREHLRGAGVKVVWTEALAAGSDIFWRDFCRNLERALPGKAKTVAALRLLGYPLDAARTGEAYHIFLDLGLARDAALVVDDFHLLPVPEEAAPAGVGGLFELLARWNGAPGPRLILISRDIYSGNRDLLELKKSLAVIDRDALALDESDIREYSRARGASLDADAARDLFRHTSGWITALYLNLLHFDKHGAASRETVERLVEREVLAPMPEEALDLLLATRPLERFTLAQAEATGGSGDVRFRLERLSRVNSFLDYNPADATYVLHAVVRSCLARRFDALPEPRRRAIWAACGECALADGDVLSALRFFGEAGEYERALEAIESAEGRRLVTKDIEPFRRIFDACPSEVLARHVSAEFQYALYAFIGGHRELFGERLARLAARCDAMPAGDAEADSRRSDLEFLLSLTAYNDIAAMSRHHRRANELRRGGATALFTHRAPWTLGSPSVLFMFHRESGELDGELRLMRECMPHYYRLASGHGSGGEHVMEAEALYHRGDFAGAELAARRAEAFALAKEQLGNALAAMYVRVRLSLFGGDYLGARAVLDDMRLCVRERNEYYYIHTVDLCAGKTLSALGRTGETAEWLKRGMGGEERLYAFAGGYYYIVHGGILLAEGRWPEAAGLCSWLLESGAFADNLLLPLHARVYLAAACQALGRTGEAAEELRRAGELAFPDGLVMPFVENWRFLAGVETGGAAVGAFERIRELAAGWERRRRGMLARHFTAAGSVLTDREVELARLAVTGMKYRDIAARTQLAHGTVKRAFATMYGKLGISSREELIRHMEASGGGDGGREASS